MNFKLVKYYKEFIILILFLIFGGIVSCIIKLAPDYDFLSYHYYNGFAFLNNRIGIDFMPASHRSYWKIPL